MPTIVQINEIAQQGCAWSLGVRLTDRVGNPLDLCTVALSCEVRRNARPSATPLATPRITIPDLDDNLVILGLSAYKMYHLPGITGTTTTSATPFYIEINAAPNTDPQNPICAGKGYLNVSPGGNKDDLDPLAPDPTTATTVITLTVAAQSGLATALVTAGTTLVISGPAPSVGQVLTMLSDGTIGWRDQTGGGGWIGSLDGGTPTSTPDYVIDGGSPPSTPEYVYDGGSP